ncbi:hypothetical protein [Rhodococcus sp. AQ5-07]|uniref:hypothetical protein n=1 Tax=Rhodococcus sp. AQ5-07 TaxID=2054902 RepID=UPI00040A0C7D|nr:hypothetical protein [Rhodococcus sp. AQ5-07]OFE06758.1 hypothetical protein A5N83_20755 [Rhodococcus sp. 1139]RAL33783.1 hypothetical protein CVN56_12480 [Rhodococcus sp. AQ5-07]
MDRRDDDGLRTSGADATELSQPSKTADATELSQPSKTAADKRKSPAVQTDRGGLSHAHQLRWC